MPDDFDSILDAAEELTLSDLNSRISSLVRFTDAELESLFPRKADKKKLLQLMQIVRSSSSANTKRRNLIRNIESVAGTVIKLVGRLA